MGNNLLKLEGKCNLLLEKSDKSVTFFCDGFDNRVVLNLLPDLGKINLEELFLETGEGKYYKCWEKKDFVPLNSFSELKDIFNKLSPEIYVFKLRFKSEILDVSIQDDRNLTLTSSIKYSSNLFSIVTTLMKNIFNFQEDLSLSLIDKLSFNDNKYLLINESGIIIGVHENYEDYLNSDQNKS